jgi:dihydrodipicolinate reductase
MRFAGRALLLSALAFAVIVGGTLAAFTTGALIELAVLRLTGFWSANFPLGLIVLVALAYGVAKAWDERS